jgi:hypothetical protein
MKPRKTVLPLALRIPPFCAPAFSLRSQQRIGLVYDESLECGHEPENSCAPLSQSPTMPVSRARRRDLIWFPEAEIARAKAAGRGCAVMTLPHVFQSRPRTAGELSRRGENPPPCRRIFLRAVIWAGIYLDRNMRQSGDAADSSLIHVRCLRPIRIGRLRLGFIPVARPRFSPRHLSSA